ncbi:DUF975 family protein [Jeotgalibaca sp. A127]|uniref:DUF975 family protein n=1 Tax=Jeotgalibaca sp. A127 TaxID=3457324 RepID=UPI003FD48EE3
MNRKTLKKQAKHDVRNNYLPWLLIALISIFIIFFQSYSQFDNYDSSSLIGKNTQIQIRIQWLNIFELIFLVPLSRLAIHLSIGSFNNVKESMFKNERWLRDIGAMLLVGLYTFLWTLLLVIPGIVKAYSYSLVPYILAEDDSITITQAIDLSQRLTDGYKWDLFVMDWSFILWDLAASLTFGLVAFYSVPYQKATWTRYYLALSR